jgi:hypothetical protein
MLGRLMKGCLSVPKTDETLRAWGKTQMVRDAVHGVRMRWADGQQMGA